MCGPSRHESAKNVRDRNEAWRHPGTGSSIKSTHPKDSRYSFCCGAREAIAPASRECLVLGSDGYGLQVNEWERELIESEHITVPFELLDRIAKGTEEWFYDLEIEFSGSDARFGLHDSTALFVAAEPEIAERIVRGFSRVRPG
jgi:hypothetical protein